MTAEELIIGHYERSLSPEQEATLSQMLEAQPEVRALYDQHGAIDGLLVAEVETIQTTSKLDKVVIGAALGTLIEIAGKGIGISLLGKIAAVVATVAVGTVGYVLIDPFGSNEPDRPAPAVRTAPAPAAPAAAMPTDTAAPMAAEPIADTPSTAAAAQRPASTQRPSAARPARPGQTQRPPGIDLGQEPPVGVQHPPRIDNSGR